jgi:hypothetical protein
MVLVGRWRQHVVEHVVLHAVGALLLVGAGVCGVLVEQVVVLVVLPGGG